MAFWKIGKKAPEFISVAKQGTIMKGDAASFPVNGVNIAVARVGDDYFGFDDTCTHMKCELSKGFLRANLIVCPCHGSEFDLTNGDVSKGPAKKPIRTYPVRVADGSIQIGI